MDQTTLQIVLFAAGLATGAILVGIAWLLSRRHASDSYSHHLRQRFGREYDHAVEEYGSRQAAESELIEREHHARGMAIRSLRGEERDQFQRQWQEVQRTFVDRPRLALREAHELLETLMSRTGYSTASYEEEIEMISVHHPDSVHHYREAHRLLQEREQEQDSTETQRQALLHYRALFADLLEDSPEAGVHVGNGDARHHISP